MFLSGDDPCLKLLREVQEHSNRRYTAPVLELLQVSGAGGLRIEGGKTQIAASRVPLADISPAEPREAALLAYRVNPPPDLLMNTRSD